MAKYKSVEEARLAKGYQYRGATEFIFGVHDEQEIFNYLFDIFTEYPRFVNRSGEPRGKVALIRKMLEDRMGRPIANTDKDLSGRIPYWVDKFFSGKMTKQIAVQPTIQAFPLYARTAENTIVVAPKGMSLTQILVFVPEGDLVDSYRITFKRI